MESRKLSAHTHAHADAQQQDVDVNGSSSSRSGDDSRSSEDLVPIVTDNLDDEASRNENDDGDPAANSTTAALPLDPALAQHEQAAQRDFRHNAIVGILFEGTWAIGMSFAIMSIFIPAYLGQLAAPRSLIGFASAMGVLTVPLQLFSERLTGGVKRKQKVWWLFGGSGLAYVLMGTAGLLLDPASSRDLLVGLFIATAAIFFILNNLASPTYQAIVTDNCPLRRRGRLFGFRAATLGVVGLLGMIPARWILQQFSPVQSFHVAMLIAGACFVGSSLTPLLFRDHLDPSRPRRRVVDPSRDLRTMARQSAQLVGELWNTPNYRVFIYFAMILAAALALGPFLITQTHDLLQPAVAVGAVASAPGTATTIARSSAQQQQFQVVFLAASIVNGLFIGAVADRWGYKLTLALQAMIAFAAFATAQSADQRWLVIVSYGLLSCVASGMPAVVCNLSVELIPRVSPAQLIAAANVIFLPMTVLLPLFAGSIIDVARAGGGARWGYHVVFTLGAALAAVGCLGIAFLVQEPRSGRVYVIKVLQRV